MNRFHVCGVSFSPIPPCTHCARTISRKLTVNATPGAHLIYPKVSYWVVIKEDENFDALKKASISTLKIVIYIRTYINGDANSIQYIFVLKPTKTTKTPPSCRGKCMGSFACKHIWCKIFYP